MQTMLATFISTFKVSASQNSFKFWRTCQLVDLCDQNCCLKEKIPGGMPHLAFSMLHTMPMAKLVLIHYCYVYATGLQNSSILSYKFTIRALTLYRISSKLYQFKCKILEDKSHIKSISDACIGKVGLNINRRTSYQWILWVTIIIVANNVCLHCCTYRSIAWKLPVM